MDTKWGPELRRALDSDEICAWFNKARQPTLEKDRVAQLYFTFLPRTAFLKTLAPAAEVVDIGAGDGSLSVFRSWPEPNREDLRFFAYSIEKGRYFDDYNGYELSDWNVSQPEFDGKRFDAVVCAHFIEHVQDPASLVRWAARKLRKGGRIYLEWPSASSLALPSRGELEKLGVPLIISRFDDDGTHQALPDGDAIADAMRNCGFSIEARGIIRLPWLEDEMLGHHKDSEDGFYRQAAFWSYTGWSQYIVAELTDGQGSFESMPAPRMRNVPAQADPALFATLRHSFAALQAAYNDSLSRLRALEAGLSEARESAAEERQQAAAALAERQKAIAGLEDENRRHFAEFQDLQSRHIQVLSSRSWRLTQPLRVLAKLLRHRAGQ